VLRKGLEKLQADGKAPTNVRAEAAAAGGSFGTVGAEPASPAVAATESNVVRELELELRYLRQQITARAKREDELKKQLTEKAATTPGLSETMTGSILRRAQQAERQVEVLKKQLRGLVWSISNPNCSSIQ
jgi:hypothetical protein